MIPHHLKSILLTLLTILLLTNPATAGKKKHKNKKPKDLIHLQWSICDVDAKTVLTKLNQGTKPPFKTQNVTYFDTDPPSYNTIGLGFRTKLHSGLPISMVKYRFTSKPSELPPNSTCVYDRYGTTTSYTCSISAPVTNTSDLWTPTQQSFAQTFYEVDWAALAPYGPYLDPKWKFKVHGHKVVFDDVMVVLPGSGDVVHLMEIEIEAKFKKADKVYERISDHLLARGVVLCGPVQTSKTERLFRAIQSKGLRKGSEEQVVLGGGAVQEEL